MAREEVFRIVSRCLMASLAEEKDGKYKIETVDYDTVVFGHGVALDSLGLATFILDLEDELSRTAQKEVVLLTDEIGKREPNPFGNVGLLCDYILEVVSEQMVS